MVQFPRILLPRTPRVNKGKKKAGLEVVAQQVLKLSRAQQRPHRAKVAQRSMIDEHVGRRYLVVDHLRDLG